MKASKIYQTFSNVILQKLKTIKPHSNSLTVALSGGVDSVVLLHLANTFQKNNPDIFISAIHVDHGLSDNAKNWQLFCTQLCDKLEIPLKIAEVSVIKKTRQSLEAVAREQRYLALFKLSDPTSIILLGQHQDDQVETFLLQLKRGSGLAGLSAMASLSSQQGRYLLRPLLNTSRAQIECFAKNYAIPHINDESNDDKRFDRNYLRHDIVPQLNERFKGFNACVSRSVELLQQQQTLIDEISQSDLIQAYHFSQSNKANTIPVPFLSSLSFARQANLVRYWLGQHNLLMPSKAILDQILNQAINAKIDAKICIQLGKHTIQRFRNELYVVDPVETILDVLDCDIETVSLSNAAKLKKCQGKGIRDIKPEEILNIRFATLKDRIKPRNKPGSNTVKHWLKSEKVPPWQRDSIPLIYYDDTLVQVVGYFINDDYAQEQGVFWQLIEENNNE
ncbi:tRNA lysidine(34) synthetase TilS [Pseudoalteromonas sp. NBT06-2]|uniref:tRNA lysidine(34) synthetase TilS n=1 Tax=Pseudoalteromonas sp. NBT06-2 TaxID=2025950 RepID=UPI000BA555CB|nr:tRNA lysidine(34) synthetase TilS [Pseudoalteromonas sp. NBT06-2]PAJ73287.1 tRNA lysidine(34) synthetase TilS [Pseudoalteromonas sp. NBT06-2]